MLQNSLDRLFTGMAACLHERVLPAIDDTAVAAQVRAVVELLGNLSTRVCWDTGYLRAIQDRVTPVLEQVAAMQGVSAGIREVVGRPLPDPVDADAMRDDVTARLEALAAAQAWLEGQVEGADAARAAVNDFGDWYLAEEMARLRSATFGRGSGSA